MLLTKFRFIWPSGYRGEDFFKSVQRYMHFEYRYLYLNKSYLSFNRGEDFLEINQSELPVAAMFVNQSGQNEQSLQKTFHRCFLPSFGSFSQAVSEEKIFLNGPIRNKNCLWRPCLLMDRDEMSKLYRGPSIDASYQVSVHLAEGFQRGRLKCEKLT